jgi:hypothetical protein
LDLTINQPSASIDIVETCGAFTWIDGNTYTENNSTATFTLTNEASCDSVVTLNLTIGSAVSVTDVISACETYIWIDGNTYTSNNNSATFTLINEFGCDSIITLDLTINQPSASTDIVQACESYTWIDGNTYTSNNSSATFTLINEFGCDSIITLDLAINQPSASTDIVETCGAFTWIDGNTYTENNSTATFTLTNAAGCDSIITLNLSVVSIDTSVTQSDNNLSANALNAAYQWLDCDDDYSVINGETNQLYSSTTNGNYAVEITIDNCIDTSACYSINIVGLEEFNANSLMIYPNPNAGKFTVELSENRLGKELQIVNVLGEAIKSINILDKTNNIQLDVANGIYFLVIDGNATRIVIKN